MKEFLCPNILIISNRVISETDNNGKTIYSFIKNIPVQYISQLYFYENIPQIEGYNYFQLSDKDVLFGKFDRSKRGRKIYADSNAVEDATIQQKYKLKRNNFTLLMREEIWKRGWKSKQLDEWLNEVRPEVILFVAGDCLFAYDICEYVLLKYRSKLLTFLTDDYIMRRSNENLFGKYRRYKIKKKLCKAIDRSSSYFTISQKMSDEYNDIFLRKSTIVFNFSDSLKITKDLPKRVDDKYILIYAGSLEYGRDEVLIELAKVIRKYNDERIIQKNILLEVYTNTKPENKFIKALQKTNGAIYQGRLTSDQLKIKLNTSDMLVVVESFKTNQMEMTKLSFSTKIPEYLSTEKPILAIGPDGIGSMDYLNGISIRIKDIGNLYSDFKKSLLNKDMMEKIRISSVEAYKELNNLADVGKRKIINELTNGVIE